MYLTYKILMNSLFGVMMTKVEKFRDFKILTNPEKANFQTKKSNFISRSIINDNLTIIEMDKTSVIYNRPLLIRSIILQNNKVRMFKYLYKIYPDVFGIYNIEIGYMDTDSIICKLKGINHEKCLEIINKYKEFFGSELGLIEIEHLNNIIKEFIGLSSKCYSYLTKEDIKNNVNKLKNNIIHSKGIANAYRNKYIDHMLFKQTISNNSKPDKIQFHNISVKNQKIYTNEINKNCIEFNNDKRYINSLYENVPHVLKIEKV